RSCTRPRRPAPRGDSCFPRVLHLPARAGAPPSGAWSLSYVRYLFHGVDLLADGGDGAVRRQNGAFLPAGVQGDLVSDKEVPAGDALLQGVHHALLLGAQAAGAAPPARRAAEHVVHAVPGDGDALLHQLPVVGVNLLALRQCRFYALLLAHLGEVHAAAEVVGGQDDALLLVHAVRGIPDLLDGLVG